MSTLAPDLSFIITGDFTVGSLRAFSTGTATVPSVAAQSVAADMTARNIPTTFFIPDPLSVASPI